MIVVDVHQLGHLMEEQKIILEILNNLFENADEDCPQENRTKHFKTAMSEAEKILIKHNIRKKII